MIFNAVCLLLPIHYRNRTANGQYTPIFGVHHQQWFLDMLTSWTEYDEFTRLMCKDVLRTGNHKWYYPIQAMSWCISITESIFATFPSFYQLKSPKCVIDGTIRTSKHWVGQSTFQFIWYSMRQLGPYSLLFESIGISPVTMYHLPIWRLFWASSCLFFLFHAVKNTYEVSWG